MTQDKITALAREYAEEYTRKTYPNVPGHVRDRIIEGRLEHMEDFIPWLLRRFCLVEKKDVETKYKEAKERYFNPDDEIEKTMYGGRISLLEYLFPEIAKEMEG